MPPGDSPVFVHNFNVHGLRLRATVDTSALGHRLCAIIGPFEVSAPWEADFVLDIRHEASAFADARPQGMQEAWRGELPDGIPAVWYRSALEQETVLPGLARMRLTQRAAEIRVAPGADWCLNLGCVLPALCDFLGRCEHYVVHAASLALEAGGARRAVLLCGPSGLGKTTTALALARSGMQLLTDDATFLHFREAAPAEMRVWGLPRPCKVHRRTVELMPWLEPHCRGLDAAYDEYLVELAPLAGPGALELAEPALVLLLEERNAQAHRFGPVGKVEAVARLVNENVRAADPRGLGPAGLAFRALAEMVRRCGTYRLSVGPELEELHEAVRPLVGPR